MVHVQELEKVEKLQFADAPTKSSRICLSNVITCEALLIACYFAAYTGIAVAHGNVFCASKIEKPSGPLLGLIMMSH
jgi:hypothetical protein